ncbi:hypothetical protein QYE76_026311 [Lolium multiflorum]|uniref:Reverse transcriptase domain-containing protein n=1 Tax=Lolium multiflorum TaxID=4521 RepID=A0AAD8VVH0_LOLMU|nr:hypothetical protein QYE76_026311 [Lolium multiflorum]
MEKILRTGLTAVLLNGVPRDWIPCRNGLRQGDPLSPYLFIIVADVLQRLIRLAWAEGGLAQPLSLDTPCPVLQYADGTLILCKATPAAAATLKRVLEDFAAATGLAINFDKSCFVPMHVSSEDAATMVATLGCPISTFPQPYLGLPLSPTKLPASAFAPLVLSFDRRLSGWQANLLSAGGRDLGESSKLPSFLEKIVDHCLPLYRAITRVEVVDGRATSFWLDKWTSGPTLATRFPAIFSHCTRLHATVATVVEGGIDLQPRLSTAAACELLEVQRLVADISLEPGADIRFIDTVRKASFSSREAYSMLSPSRPTDASSCVAWSLRLPSKLKIFAYLADIDRLSTRANLFHKSCAPSETCAACDSVETCRHLFFECAMASHVWARLGVYVPVGRFSIWDLPAPLGVTPSTWHFGVAAVMWSIWKTRNDLVFNGNTPPSFTIRRACDDIALWRWRIPHPGRADVDFLRSYMISRCA